MMKKNTIQEIIVALLVLLLVYTGVSKYAGWEQFQRGIHKQHFPKWLELLTVWTLPPAELVTALLLMVVRTRIYGLVLSQTLLLIFTAYVAGVYWNIIPGQPCPCGGIIRTFDWGQHLLFNLFFLLLNSIALVTAFRKNRRPFASPERQALFP
jgi:putative oxidoreductase